MKQIQRGTIGRLAGGVQLAARRYRTRRSAAIIAGIAAIAGHSAAAVLAWRSPDISAAMALTFVAGAILWVPWSAIGILIAAKGIRTNGSTMLALAMTLIALNNAFEPLPGTLKQVPGWLVAVDGASAFLAAGAFLRSSQLFPHQLKASELLSPGAVPGRLAWLQRGLAALLRPWAMWSVAALWLALAFSPFDTLVTVATVMVVMLGAAFWWAQQRVGNATVRHRVTWILQTAVVFAMVYLLTSLVMALLRAAGAGVDVRAYVFVVHNLILAILGCGSMAMAVFGAGAFNPALVVRSTVIYGAAVSVLLFALNVTISFLVDSAVDAFGLNDRLVAATLGAIAGLCVEPLAKLFGRVWKRGVPGGSESA